MMMCQRASQHKNGKITAFSFDCQSYFAVCSGPILRMGRYEPHRASLGLVDLPSAPRGKPRVRGPHSTEKCHLHNASYCGRVSNVPGKFQSRRRSGCPVSISLEALGDRWSLLIIRDLMVRGFRTFREFEESGEGISTNILADRLRQLEAKGIITVKVQETDRRRQNYRLTEKGIDLAPVLLDLLIWGARHEETKAPCARIEEWAKNREQVLAEVRRRWQERDSTPLMPRLGRGGGG